MATAMRPQLAHPADIRIENHGSIVLLRSENTRAYNWLVEHVASDAHWLGWALVVEPRYVADIVQGALDNGLEVA